MKRDRNKEGKSKAKLHNNWIICHPIRSNRKIQLSIYVRLVIRLDLNFGIWLVERWLELRLNNIFERKGKCAWQPFGPPALSATPSGRHSRLRIKLKKLNYLQPKHSKAFNRFLRPESLICKMPFQFVPIRKIE